MPLGTHHVVTGRLRRAGHLLTLDVDDGGEWRLDGPPTLDRLVDRHVGRRVRVEGIREGFDLLGVICIEPM